MNMKRVIVGLAILMVSSAALQATDWRSIEAQRRLEADRDLRAQGAALQKQGVINAARVTRTPAEWQAGVQRQQAASAAAMESRVVDQATAEALARADIASATETAKKAELEKSKVWFIVSMFLGLALLGWVVGWIIRSCKRECPTRIRITA